MDATCKAIADAHKETEDSQTEKKHAHETATDADANNDAGINDADDDDITDADDYNAEIDAYFEAMDRAKADDVNTDVGGLRNELFDLSATGTGFGTIVGTAAGADAVQIRMSPTSTYFDGEMSKAAIDLNSIDPTTDPAGFYDAQARFDFWQNAYDTRQLHVQGARETVAATRDVAADVARNWKVYGLAAAESLPGGVGTGVEAGHHGVDIFKGNQTVLGAAAIMGTEAAVGYVGGKVVKLFGRAATKISKAIAHRIEARRVGGVGSSDYVVGTPNQNPSQFTSRIFNEERITWIAPNGTKQTYQIRQRNDIDWNMIRTGGDKRFRGKTNLQAANAGLSPQLSDGKFATLHHLGQDSRGGLVEASTKYHDFGSARLPNGKQYFDVIHGQHGYRKKNPDYPVDHTPFKQDTSAYWKERVDGILPNG